MPNTNLIQDATNVGTKKIDLKKLTEKQVLMVVENHINSLSLQELKDLRSLIGLNIQAHHDYVKKETPEHLKNKKSDLDKVLNTLFSKNAAYKKIVSLQKEGQINLSSWSAKDVTDSQLSFMLKSYKNLFYFTTKEESVLIQASPKIIGEIIVRAAIMKPENFAKCLINKKVS